MPSIENNLIIRADASTRMGTGHVMRCIALGQAWQDAFQGAVVFISAEIPDGLAARLQSENFGLIRINAVPGSSEDLRQTLAAVSDLRSHPSSLSRPWLVLDGYHLQLDYQCVVREAGFKLLLVDDYNHLPEYECDILLNQNINAPELEYQVNSDAKKLLGTSYALLRREFQCLESSGREFPKGGRNILVTLGGADPDNVTLRVIEALQQLDIPDSHAKVIVGPANLHLESLQQAVARSAFDVQLLTHVLDMTELMTWADLAVSAAGSTCWELCCLGVPLLTVILAENQAGLAVALEKNGASRNMGWHDESDGVGFADAILALLGNADLREGLSCRAQQLVDGRGGFRVIETIKKG